MAQETKQTKEQTIEEIIKISGVSRSTVFRFLAGKQIRASSRVAITEALQQVSLPEPGRNKDSRDIIVSVCEKFDVFRGYAEVIDGILHQASETGSRVRLDRNMHADKTGAGVIIVGMNASEEDEEIALLKEKKIPYVLVNRMIDDPAMSWVSANNRQVGYDACTHLISKGRRRIAIWRDTVSRVSIEKFAGYRDALLASGIEYASELAFNSAEVSLEAAFKSALKSKGSIDAWIGDDEICIRVMRLATDAGLKIPADLAICGMNDIEAAENFIPSLTSVHLPFREMGVTAVKSLGFLMENALADSVKTVLRHELIARDSTRA